MKKFLRLLFASALLVTVLLSCNSESSDGAMVDNVATQMQNPFGMRAPELMNNIAHSINEGQSILEYGHYAVELQKELKNIMDTCTNNGFRFFVRRFASGISNDLYNRTKDDSLQRAYYTDSIEAPYSQIEYHWYKGYIDDGLMLYSEAFTTEDSLVWVFPMNIFASEDYGGKYIMAVEYPKDVVGETRLFVWDSDKDSPAWTIGPEDTFVDVLEKGVNYYSGNTTIVFPLDSILPYIRKHDTIVLSYLSDVASDDKYRLAVFSMKEFLKLYDALGIK